MLALLFLTSIEEVDVKKNGAEKKAVDESKRKGSTSDKIATIAIVGGVGAAALATAPILLGFSASGVVAGSLAAGFQAGLGNVMAGSAFACLQSLAATGTLGAVQLAGGAAAAAGIAMKVVPKEEREESATENNQRKSPE